MADHDRHEKLAAFLRARRESLQPEDAGHPPSRRRRAKGLRREEVAERADISVTWYTWLEQGRPVRPSESTLNRVAEALRLSPAEHLYLFTLALPDRFPPLRSTGEVVSPSLRQALTAQGNNPAFLVNGLTDILDSNAAARRVFSDERMLPVAERNILWQMFAFPMTRQLIEDWEVNARNLLGIFRSNWARAAGDPRYATLIEALQGRSPEFRIWWPEHSAGDRSIRPKILNHPLVGRLELEQIAFQVEGSTDLTFLLYAPAPGTGTVEKLAQLATLDSRPDGNDERDENLSTPPKPPTGSDEPAVQANEANPENVEYDQK
ncbi:helix-turn-helix transcriptional regulator [Nitrolancea hollandica]|uniref:Helix-turn-helix domain protein n=1 Tax=Nitrolancea hollandica Lb TaxID=1129897 RepID=I4EET3_9BACT|nr:helix-turn-helix domain-containing protein [Nitrolancea hollandica]CCF83195.1 Helix-turn-helix domain protein [Nitrolancea hollandica Lb]